jgi:hypothetical protein
MLPVFVETLEVSSKYVPQELEAFPVSVTAPLLVTTDPVVKYKPPTVLANEPVFIETAPPVDSTLAVNVPLALPLIVILPPAVIAPVGETVVPPAIEMFPAELSWPAPE